MICKAYISLTPKGALKYFAYMLSEIPWFYTAMSPSVVAAYIG